MPADAWEWLSVAQHHGLSTRLLDWTLSPLSGLYFATRIVPVRLPDSVLYVLPKNALPEVADRIHPFDVDVVSIFYPTHVAPRMSAQSAVLTIHPRPAEVFDHPQLERWLLSGCSADVFARLYGFGFSEATMFPDLDGLARSLEALLYIAAVPQAVDRDDPN